MSERLGTDWWWQEISKEEFFRRKPEEGEQAFGGWSKDFYHSMTAWGKEPETIPRLAVLQEGEENFRYFQRERMPTDKGMEEMSAGVPCAEETRSCNNDDCDWVGPISQTVHPKHVPEMILCPVCNETTECVHEQAQAGP